MRDKTHITYNSAIGVIFGVKKYANELLKVLKIYNLFDDKFVDYYH